LSAVFLVQTPTGHGILLIIASEKQLPGTPAMPFEMSALQKTVLQSEIRSMTIACNKIGGINLAQGICDCPLPAPVGTGAKDAIDKGINTYTRFDGRAELRAAIAEKYRRFYGMAVDPESEIVVSCGATGAFYCTCLALLNPGDDVIVFEPYYGYHINTLSMLGVRAKFVRLDLPLWHVSADAIDSAITAQTRAILVNTPANPSGKVFSSGDLQTIAAAAKKHDLWVFTDEIYEHFVYDDLRHIPLATLPGMRERTVTISGLSKTFSITGWRIGYAICDRQYAQAIGHFSDLVYVCAPAPLQAGAARGMMDLGQDYYNGLSREFLRKRSKLCDALAGAGLAPIVPQGAYYVLSDLTRVPGNNSREKAMALLDKTGIACVPGCAFYHDTSGENLGRFCFAKEEAVIDEVCGRLNGFL
jgi:aminotransferase